MRLVTVGVGAQNSPRYAPAGLLVATRFARVMLDGGPRAEPSSHLQAWLVTDDRAELIREIRRLATRLSLEPAVAEFGSRDLRIRPKLVVHTNHATFGYLIEEGGGKLVWAPEFLEFPKWARGADLMFSEAAGWNRPIRFRGGVGGHLDVLHVAEEAKRHGVKRLVFAHIGRPTIRAIDRGKRPPFGEFGTDGQVFRVRPSR